MSYCEKCKRTNVIEAENGNYCCNCGWDSTKKKYVKKQTNADRIRSMDDEELAEFIDKVSGTCLVDALGGKSECNTECRVCKIKFGSILDWLQSEAE